MNRIAELRKEKGLSQKAFGKLIGAAQNTVCNWENGNREPDNATLKKMAYVFDCSVDYLLGRTNFGRTFVFDSSLNEDASSTAGKALIPVLGDVAAGLPMYAEENIIDYEEVSEDLANSGNEFFALRIKGSSMEPRIMEGDVVIVRKQSDVENGDIAVVLVNGDSATVKKVKKTAHGIALIPNNPSYEPMFYTNEEIKNLPITIIGKVIELRGKF